MAITVQALQADGTWGVRSAFTTENAKVRAGSMKAADLEALARAAMSKWQSSMQDGKQLRVHNSANDQKPAQRDTLAAVTKDELQIAIDVSEGEGASAEAAYQLVRFCRGQIFYRDLAETALREIRSKALPAHAAA